MQSQRIKKLNELLAENQDDTFALYAMGMELEGLNQPEEAIDFFKKVLLLEPGKVAAYYRIGYLLHQKGNDLAALEMLKSGLNQIQTSNDHKTKNEFKSLIDEIEF